MNNVEIEEKSRLNATAESPENNKENIFLSGLSVLSG